jgi:hypothetical protein
MENAAKSIEVLFAEPFEPQWMKQRQQDEALAEVQELNDMLTRNDFNWKESAKESRERIAAKFSQRTNS